MAGRLRCGVVVVRRVLHMVWCGGRQGAEVLPIPPTGPCRPPPLPSRERAPGHAPAVSPAGRRRPRAALTQPSRSPPQIRDQVVLPPGRIAAEARKGWPHLATGHTAAAGNENARLCGGGHRWAHEDGSTSKTAPPPPPPCLQPTHSSLLLTNVTLE